MKPLTPTQRRVYEFLLAFLLEHQRQPTVRDVGRAMGWRFPNQVVRAFEQLTQRGLISWEEKGKQKRWRITGITLRAEPVAEPQTQGANNGHKTTA